MQLFLLHSQPEWKQRLLPCMQSSGVDVIQVESIDDVLQYTVRTSNQESCLLTFLSTGFFSAVGMLSELQSERPTIPLIICSDGFDVPGTVELIKRGVFAVCESRCSDSTLLLTIYQALQHSRELCNQQADRERLLARFRELSRGEMAVFGLLLEGLSNKEIASRLGVSRRTIEARRQRIGRVTGIQSIVRLVMLLAKHDLLDQVSQAGYQCALQ